MARSVITVTAVTRRSKGRPWSGSGDDRQAFPSEGADHHHEHHPDQGGERDLLDQIGREKNEPVQEQRRGGPRQPRPPDFTLITLCPIIAQPPMPPKKPVTVLATPWARHSREAALGRGHVGDHVQGQQAFDQADGGEDQGRAR